MNKDAAAGCGIPESLEQAKRLLFFDIDGTLIADNRRIPDSVIPALNSARRCGCLLFINTGRTLCAVKNLMDLLPLDGTVTGCGTRVVCLGKTLRAVEYDSSDSLRIRRRILSLGIPSVYECDTGMYFDPEYPDTPVITEFRNHSDSVGLTRDISESDPEYRIVKMFSFSSEEKVIRNLLGRLKEDGYPFEAIDRGNDAWEIVPEGCSKAGGIDVVREALNVPLENCYAFGDSTNDLTMLEHVPHSVAMGNAPDEIKRLCSFVADLPERDGIAKALADLGLIPGQ